MTTGRAAKFAYDPKVLLAFIDARTELRTGGSPSRTRRFINGCSIDHDTDARIIRRWRNGVEGVTKPAASRLLRKFNLSTAAFVEWAYANDLIPIIRGAS